MISTHVLDLHSGNPAAGIKVCLEKKSAQGWIKVMEAPTNSDGRISFGNSTDSGVYQLTFQIEDYLKKSNASPFFTVAQVVFQISDVSRKYHVPLLLSPYGYSTYRGS